MGQSFNLELPKCLANSNRNCQLNVSDNSRSADRDSDHSDVEYTLLTSTNEVAANASNSGPGDKYSKIHLDANQQPILVFYNSKAQSQLAASIISKVKSLLDDQQVRDLAEENGPTRGLRLFEDVRNLRILACGGDGTVGWVLEGVDSHSWKEEQPPVAILPIGTGNDLARCLGWGSKCKCSDVPALLEKVTRGSIVKLDRWHLDFSDTPLIDADSDNDDIKDNIPCYNLNNYFSIGIDAEIARQFHISRSKCPAKFSSKLRNLMSYTKHGLKVSMSKQHTCIDLDQHVDIMCDGHHLDLGRYGPLQGIAVLNITFIYGGSRLWGIKAGHKKKQKEGNVSGDAYWVSQNFSDHMIEIVGLKSAFQVGLAAGRIWKKGKPLAQCCEAVIRTRKSLSMQIDGEPWWQPPCRISISMKNQVPMVLGPV